MADNANSVATTFERMLELSLSPLSDWTDTEILETVRLQFKQSDDYLQVKRNNWVDYTRLYLNQYRKDSSPDTLGAKIVFSKFHETYANFSADEKTVDFEARALSDVETVAMLNKVADFDWDEFDGSTVWNEWEWDKLFYGFGVLDVSDWDGRRKVIRPVVQNPFLFFFDPLAVSDTAMRFAGNYQYSTYYDLINETDIDEEQVKKMAKTSVSFTSPANSTNMATQAYRDAKNILLNGTQYYEPVTATGYLETVRWFLKNAGQTYEIKTSKDFKYLLGWKALTYNDAKDGNGSEIPFIVKQHYKFPRSVAGHGVPDLVEDDHRAMVKLINFMFQGVKTDSVPTWLYNYKAFVNPKDLLTREINKNIPLNGTVDGNVMPFPKSGVVSQDTLAFLNLLETRSDGAIGSSKILRGSLSSVKKSATEVAVAKAKQDLMLAARSKETIPAETRFWYTYLRRYRKHLGKNSEKLVRLLGKSGVREMKELKGKDFIPETDPDIKVTSKLVSEPQRVMARKDLAELIEPTVQAGGNLREMLKKIYYQYEAFTKEDITNILPPTPHELRAQEENEQLDNGELPLIHENDDDVTHIAEHQKADQSQKVTEAHIKAHYLNYLRKAKLTDENAPDQVQNPQLGNTPPNPQQQAKQVAGNPLGGQQNQLTPSDVK